MIAYAQRGVTNVGDLEQRYVPAALPGVYACAAESDTCS
jgi:hypothetical protein